MAAYIDYHRMTAAAMFDCKYGEVTPSQRNAAKARNFYLMYTPGVTFMVNAQELERRMTRAEIVEILEGRYCIQCYDHESLSELAEALAEAANTEGDTL